MSIASEKLNHSDRSMAAPGDVILVTGGTGFIGRWVVAKLLDEGFRNIRLLTRPGTDASVIERTTGRLAGSRVELVRGNLLNAADCARAARGVSVVYHLAAGTGEKSYAAAYLNSVVSTRNLLEACAGQPSLRRFVSISSFAVYSNRNKPRGQLLDETCPVEEQPVLRGEAYCYAKIKQDELVAEYGKRLGIPYVILRPGAVYGPGKDGITGRVGVSPLGFFAHLGGGNRIPFTYVENCADAIVLAGLREGAEGEVFNIVDDDLPTSRAFIRQYKRQARPLRSVYIPGFMSYLICWMWEKYAYWSEGQLPMSYNTRAWHAYWKNTRYTNDKLKRKLGWTPKVSTEDGMSRFFASCRSNGGSHA
jgi:nucleoside-diphosphate-sugar epimerase